MEAPPGKGIYVHAMLIPCRKEYSKSDKHIWEAAAQAEEKRREQARLDKKAERNAIADEIKKQRQDMQYSIDDPEKRAAEAVPPASPPKQKGVRVCLLFSGFY